MARLFNVLSLKIEFDYIPEGNPPQIKVFLRESQRKRDKGYTLYRQATYGRSSGCCNNNDMSKTMHSESAAERRL